MELLAREELAIHSVVNGSDDTSAEWATFYEEVMQHLFQDEEQAKKYVRKHEGVKLRIKMLQRLRAETIAADFDRWSAWQVRPEQYHRVTSRDVTHSMRFRESSCD